jgi:hypothetical protein
MAATSSNAERSTHNDTSWMVRPVFAAAYSIGASSLVARVSQNLAASWRSSTAAASASQTAVVVASGKVVEVSSGDQRTESRPVEPVGSNRCTGPVVARWATVRSYTSRLTEVTTAGPSQRSRLGTTSRVDLPVRVGAIAITEVRAGTRTSWWPWLPISNRPAAGGSSPPARGAGESRRVRSRREAHTREPIRSR